MDLITKYILKQVGSQSLSPEEAKILLEDYGKNDEKRDDIAIIGMAAKFPGAQNLDEYWDILKNGKNCFTEYPKERINPYLNSILTPYFFEYFTGTTLKENEKIEFLQTLGGYIDDVDMFDAAFFHISPKEAKYMHPEQRIFLETAWETIEDAGYSSKSIVGTKTGVFVGIDKSNTQLYKHLTEQDTMHMTGSWSGILASRLAYLYNLKGPCLVIDTACSSGLVALHVASQSLKNKECDLAIAGGIQLSELGIVPKNGEAGMSLKIVEATDNVLRSFDKNSSGTVWGEGVGAVLLKPLKKAIEDGDNIHAIIRGSAINNDGASNSITTPNAEAQEEVIVSAWKQAGINPEKISYIEAHGTGTKLGDPIEIKGITNAFARFTNKKQFCGIGSVKPNIGHAVGASGFSSLFKVILAMKNEAIPPTINFEEPNPYINFCESPVYVNDTLQEWKKSDNPRIAGASAFGFSGTNCHVVLEEKPSLLSEYHTVNDIQIISISAKSKNVLENLVNNYIKFLDGKASKFNMSLEDICFTANMGRGHYTHRLAFIIKSFDELKDKLHKFLNKSYLDDDCIYYGEHSIVSNTKKERDVNELTEEIKQKMSNDANSTINKILADKLLDEEAFRALCSYYIKGADIEWKEIYKDRKLRRVSIPTYPFERIKYWADEREFSKSEPKNISSHPLIDRCLADSMESMIFTTKFSTKRHWVLTEHRFAKMCLIPGVTYIEMAREACSKYFNSSSIELNDVIFMAPIFIEEGEEKEVQTIIKKFDDYLEFSIVTKDDSKDFEKRENWVVHVKGKASLISKKDLDIYDIEAIKGECNIDLGKVSLNIPTPPESKAIGKFEFGSRWDIMPSKRIGNEKELITIELQQNLIDDLEEFYFHPSMLDCACNAPMFANSNGIYLPFLFKSIKILDKMPQKFYSYIQKKNGDANETLDSDITLIDIDGRPFAEIKGYSAKKVHLSQQRKFKEDKNKINNFYSMQWSSCELNNSIPLKSNEPIIVIKGKDKICQDVINEIRNLGNIVIEVEYGTKYEKVSQYQYRISGRTEDYSRLIQESTNYRLKQVIHMGTLNEGKEVVDIEDLNNKLETGVHSLFNLVTAILENKLGGEVEIALISDYANAITGTEERINPHNATLFGLGKVVGQEYSNIKCKCIDIDIETKSSNIVSELSAPTYCYKVAYRNNQRYIEEFSRIKKENIKNLNFEVKEQGVYIITGGTGGIGFEIGKYLASKKNINLVLLNRSPFPTREEMDNIAALNENKKICEKISKIKEIIDIGSNVECFSVDISNENNMKNIISKLMEKYKKIDGIIHLAGIAGDGFIINKDQNTFNEVLKPKVHGTWILDKLTKDMNIDVFVMFSSMISLLGGPGQGDYTAANSYLDSFSDYRNKNGKRTITLNWPGWKETGMAVDFNVKADESIFKPILTSSAIEAFEYCLGTDLTRVLPGEFNYNVSWDISNINFSDEIREVFERKINQRESSKSQKMKITDVKIKGRNSEDYSPTETALAYICAEVFSINEVDIYQEFYDIGMDSLLAAQLLGQIEKRYDKIVGFGDIFEYSSINNMADYIDSKIS